MNKRVTLGLLAIAALALSQGVAQPKKFVIGFSSPGADHGWTGAIITNAKTTAAKYKDVTLLLTEGVNDAAKQVGDVESLITRKVDVIVLLPHSGAELTPVARKAMKAGIPVINLDRKLETEDAYYTFLGGDNYGIGKSAGEYFAQRLKGTGNVAEIQGLAGISVTEERSRGFRDALKAYPNIKIVASQPGDFSAEKGLTVMENILQSQPKIDAVYTHDDDMAVGVVRAITNAKREKGLFVTGAGGSCWAYNEIKKGSSIFQASFLYNPSMASTAVAVARAVALKRGLAEFAEPEMPRSMVIRASTVTKANVATFQKICFK